MWPETLHFLAMRADPAPRQMLVVATASKPWRLAVQLDFALPSAVFGPVLWRCSLRMAPQSGRFVRHPATSDLTFSSETRFSVQDDRDLDGTQHRCGDQEQEGDRGECRVEGDHCGLTGEGPTQ